MCSLADSQFPLFPPEFWNRLSARRTDGRSIACLSGSRLLVKSLDADVPVVLANAQAIQSPTWSPDGSRVFFLKHEFAQTGWDVSSVARTGGEPVLLFNQATLGNIGPEDIAMAPDGTTLAIIGLDRSGPKRVRRVWLSTPPGAPPKPVAGFDPPCCSAPAPITWSSDSKRMVATISTAGHREHWLIRASGGSNLV